MEYKHCFVRAAGWLFPSFRYTDGPRATLLQVRVTLVTHEASLSGAPVIAVHVVDELRRHGHTVTVVSRRRGPLLSRFLGEAPCRVEPLARWRDRLWQYPTTRPFASLLEIVTSFVSIAATRPDVLYLNSTASAPYLRPAVWLRRPCILHVHEDYETARMFLDACRTRRLMRRAVIIACAPSVRRDVAKLAGLPPEAVHLVEYMTDPAVIERKAADADSPATDADEIVLGTCATVEHRKGTDLWLRAMAMIREQRPDRAVRFLWVGPVREPSLIRGFEDCFVGPMQNPLGYLSRFDVLVLPSRREAAPVVVLEAMSLGVPIVAFDVGSIGDRLGPAGRVVEPEDADALAAALIELVDDEALRTSLGRRARERSRELYEGSDFGGGLTRAIAAATGGAG